MTVRVRFGEVVRKVNDKIDPVKSGVERYVAGEHMDTDEPRIHRWGTVGNGYLGPAFHMRFKPGHILYGSRRTYLRKVAMADFAGVCANTTYVLEPSTPHLLPEFLLLVMSTERFHQNSISLSKGSTNPYINFSDIEPFEFDLPDLKKQKELKNLLSSIQDQRNNFRNLIDSGSKAKKATFLSSAKPSSFGTKKWQLRNVVDVLDHLRRPVNSSERAKRQGDVPYYGATGRTGWIDQYLFDEELVLLGEDAVDFANPGATKAFVITGKSWVNNHAHVLRVRSELLDANYLEMTLNNLDYSPFVTFGTRSKLTKEAMLRIEFELPPRDAQMEIMRQVNAIEMTMTAAKTALESCENLFRAVLNTELL